MLLLSRLDFETRFKIPANLYHPESGQPASEKTIHVDLVKIGDIIKIMSGEQVCRCNVGFIADICLPSVCKVTTLRGSYLGRR